MNVSAEPSLIVKLQEPEVKPQNTAVEITARLEAAAAHRKMRIPPKEPWRSDYEGRDNKSSKVRSLDLPDSCNCIADRNVGNAIAKFFTLAQKLQLLNEAEASDVRLKISVVANMASESYAKYLGNFEIIYQLAQRLSDRFPRSMYINYTSDDVFRHLDEVVNLDEEVEEELNDDIEPGISYETTEFDWGW